MGRTPDPGAPLAAVLGRPLPPPFGRWEVTVPTGATLPYDPAAWHGALVVVVRGEVELEAADGHRVRFGAGGVLTLSGLSLRAVHSVGPDACVLLAVARRSGAAARCTGPPYEPR